MTYSNLAQGVFFFVLCHLPEQQGVCAASGGVNVCTEHPGSGLAG